MRDRDTNKDISKEMKQSNGQAKAGAGITDITPIQRSHGPSYDLAFPIERKVRLRFH